VEVKPFGIANEEDADQTSEAPADNNPFISRARAPAPVEPNEVESAESSLDLLALGRELLAKEAERAELNQQPKSSQASAASGDAGNSPADAAFGGERPAAAGPSPLHALLFEDVDASDPYASGLAADPAYDAFFDPAALWPRGLLSSQLAAKLLTSAEPPELLQPSIRRLQSALVPIERAALDGGALPFDGEPLRKAVLLRWQLSAALDLKPPVESNIDTAALDHLLAETDVVLCGLQVPADAPKETRRAFDSARTGLVKQAVRLAEVARTLVVAAAPETRAVSEQKYKNVSARLLSMSTVGKREWISLGSKGPWIALAVTAAAAIVFHGTAMRKQRDPIIPDVVRIGELFSAKAPNGINLVLAPGGKPVNPADLDKLKAEAEARGKTVHQLAPGQFVVAPAEMPIPDMPKNAPFAK